MISISGLVIQNWIIRPPIKLYHTKDFFYLLNTRTIIDICNSNANINLGKFYCVVAEYNISPNVNEGAEILCQVYHPRIQQIQNCSKLPKMTTKLVAVLLCIYSLVKLFFLVKN